MPSTTVMAALAALLALPLTGVDDPPAPAVYNGRANQLDVRVPRVDAGIVLDGSLDDPIWRRAALLTGFSEYTPLDGLPAEDSTEVFVWYSPKFIYFGIRAYEPHGGVHYKLADRDRIDADDNVQIILSPFLHSRQALVFSVNPLGVQEDGTMTEGIARGLANFSTSTTQTGRPGTDLNPDFVYESKGHVTPFGYEVVVKVPFRSIKRSPEETQDWGINVLRKVQHSGHEQTWVPSRLAAASFLSQSGTLAGLTGLDRSLVLDLNPFVTTQGVGDGSNPQSWRYGVSRPAFGTNLKWGITSNLSLSGTFRPDFAEVESDATNLILDPRNLVSYPEKRPFFLEGLQALNTPSSLIYTRAIVAPLGASMLTGKIGGTTLAYLFAQDQESASITGAGHPLFNVMRLQRDVGGESVVGFTATDKEQGGAFSRLAAVDTRVPFRKIYSLQLQAATSVTRDSAGHPSAGPLWYARFQRAGRTFGMDYSLRGTDPEFVAASGFVSRTGLGSLSIDHRVTFYRPPGSFVETFGGDMRYAGTWVYRNFTRFSTAEDQRYQFNLTATLRGGWQVGAAVYLESYGYDSTIYKNTYIAFPGNGGTAYNRFPSQKNLPNTDLIATLTSPQFAHFSMSIVELWGKDENFYEWSSASVQVPSVALTWQPTPAIRVHGSYNAAFYWRRTDGSEVAHTSIPRLQTEYQITRSTFVRLVAQYVAAYQDSLRDDGRTNFPLYYKSGSGGFTRAAAHSSNVFESSILFSYRPVPGTVAFIGYGNDAFEPGALRFARLRRTSDSFFVKFSYLFRLSNASRNGGLSRD